MSTLAPWSRRAELVATTAFWVLLTGLLLLRRALGPMGFVSLTVPGAVGTVAEYGVWVVLTPLVFALARRFPLDRERGAWRLAGLLLAGLGIAAAVEMSRLALMTGLVDVGVLDALPEMRGPRPPGLQPVPLGGVVRFQFLDEFVIYAGVLAAGFARSYALQAFKRETESARLTSEAAELEAERSQLQGQLTEARLSALRMQLNPHFLFNALNAVSAYIERDPERAQTMLAQLAGLLRRVLDGDARPEVPLADELALLRDYLAIQQARFGDGLVVEEAVDADALDALVPSLVLQPLAENAVEHGVSRLVGSTGQIQVGARTEAGVDGATRLVLTVSDNGPGPDASTDRPESGVGLANTRDRLHALYGEDAALTLDSGPDGGAVVTVVLPLRHIATPAHV